MDLIINWYYKLPVDFLGVNELIYKRQRLSGLLAVYSNELGLQKKIWYTAKLIHEKEKMQLRSKFILIDKYTTAKAETLSRANTIESLEVELMSEAEYYRMHHKVKSYYEILSAMSQQIAFLRNEFINIKNG